MSIFSDKFDQLKKADKAVKSPKYLQEVMGIGRIAENGIFEVGKGIYSKTYRFLDINYVTAGAEEQMRILKQYCKTVNAIDVYFLITIFNRNKNMQDFREHVLFQEKGDGFNWLRGSYNQIIEKRIVDGRQGIEQELNEKSGVCYGINQVSHNLCIGNRKKLANGNGMVFGVPGSGKSYFSKSEMLQVFLGTDDDIICIDPTLEYFDIAEALGNQAAIINLSTYTKNYINPLEMDVWALDLNDSQGYIRDKGEFMLGLCEQCYGDNLNSRHKSIIDRCVRKLYIDIAKAREKHIPTMSEFYELLLEQPEEEAKDIALSLELFVNGSLNIFNNHTNVNVQARFIVYGTRDLGKELGAISTLVMLENISARIAENAKKGRATWLYIDEFHTVLDREYSAKFLFSLWKKVRKQGGLCTGITQNLVDMLQNYTAMTMLGNSEFIALLKQSNVDSQELSTAAGIPEAQLKYVDNSPSGTGIIKY